MSQPARPEELERVAMAFRALAHPVRLQILEALRSTDVLSPKQLAQVVEPTLSLGTISHHTRELHTFGLLAPAGTEAVRGALRHLYRLSERGRSLLEVVDRLVASAP